MLKQGTLVRTFTQIAICKSHGIVPLTTVVSIPLAASIEGGGGVLKQGTLFRTNTQIAI
jgi:hypothetical protein